MSSYIGILRGQRTLTYDLMAFLLYATWAAIDIFRQLGKKDPSIGPIAAAVVISFWALVYVSIQWLLTNRGLSAWRKIDIALGCTAILLGVALITNAMYLYLHRETVEQLVQGMGLENKHDAEVLWLRLKRGFAFGASAAFFVLLFPGLVASIAMVGQPIPAFSGILRYRSFSIFIAGLLFCFTAYFAVFLGFLFSGAKKPCCYLLKPCTTQSISEWDQAFALMLALVVLVLEFGADAYRYIRRRAIGFKIKWFPGSRF